MNNLVPFKKEHIDIFNDLRYADWYAFKNIPDWKDNVLSLLTFGESVSLLKDNRLLCIANTRLLWDGVAELWALTTPLVTKYPILFYKTTVGLIEDNIKKYNLHRIQCKVIAGFQESHNLMDKLGFTVEAYMKQYGPLKEDYVQYVRLV